MATRTRRNDDRDRLTRKRIDGKLKLLREYPDAIVYTFDNVVAKERFLRPTRQIEMAYATIMDLWGFQIDSEAKEKADKLLDESVEKAKEVVAFVESNVHNIYDIGKLLDMRRFEKSKLIKESADNGIVYELLIPLFDKTKDLYYALIYIDKHDIDLKQSGLGDQWIAIVKWYYDTLVRIRDELFNILKSVEPKYLNKFKAIRKEIERLQKNENGEN